jgi:hypothetical protein
LFKMQRNDAVGTVQKVRHRHKKSLVHTRQISRAGGGTASVGTDGLHRKPQQMPPIITDGDCLGAV